MDSPARDTSRLLEHQHSGTVAAAYQDDAPRRWRSIGEKWWARGAALGLFGVAGCLLLTTQYYNSTSFDGVANTNTKTNTTNTSQTPTSPALDLHTTAFLSAVHDLAARTEAAALGADGAGLTCVNANVTLFGTCTGAAAIHVTSCAVGAGYSYTGNAQQHGKEGHSDRRPRAKLAILEAVNRLLGKMDVDPAAQEQDCACQLDMTVPDGSKCTSGVIGLGHCLYYTSPVEIDQGYPPRVRAKAWDTQDTTHAGVSDGYDHPYNNEDRYPTDLDRAHLAAADALRAAYPATCQAVPPMVFIPGYTSSALQYKASGAAPVPHAPQCPTDTYNQWVPLWPLPTNSKFRDLPCEIANLALDFDASDNSFTEREGVAVDTKGFGTFEGLAGQQGVMRVVKHFQLSGWELGHSLVAAPFDWRLPGPALHNFIARLKNLVEDTYARNGNRKVVLTSLSYGPQVTLSFLHRMTQDWKDTHVAWFVANSPVWSGSPDALMSYIAPANVPNKPNAFPGSLAAVLSRRLPSLTWMFPRAGHTGATWSRDEPLIYTPRQNYTAFDMQLLLTDLGVSPERIAEQAYLASETDLGEFAAPGVPTLITYGRAIPTPMAAHYDTSFTPGQTKFPPPSINTNSGDGVVPVRSSTRGQQWADAAAKQGKALVHKDYPAQPHAACYRAVEDGKERHYNQCMFDVIDQITA